MITIDIDGKTKFEATIKMIISYINLKSFYPRKDPIIHLTKRGYHLIVYGDDGDLERERSLREIFGDDPMRIHIDRYKNEIGSHNLNVLWTIKKGYRVKEIDHHLLM
tara:strand:- start:1140 stop:1460 length:321 start_codon:yes stop_codon:yes gene_type:complete